MPAEIRKVTQRNYAAVAIFKGKTVVKIAKSSLSWGGHLTLVAAVHTDSLANMPLSLDPHPSGQGGWW